MTAEHESKLDALLALWVPKSILTVGARSERLLARFAAAKPSSQITRLATDDAFDGVLGMLASTGRFDFALVAGLLEQADPDACFKVVSRLRDLHAKRLCVHVETQDTAGEWTHDGLVTLGLQPLFESDGGRIYGFDINAYKDTPDWLSAKHWANPELWGKHRW